MRIHRLQIPAFGPFTNLELKFPSGQHDLHVVYGENEAGKSSLLRAIRDLLFGVHGQSPDNFLHDYKALRLLGEISSRAGDELIFQRRKGNKNTLLDKDGNPLPDSALAPFIGSVDLAYFSSMFGLGGSELHEGAQQLLRGEGEIGTALFSASMGGTPIQKVLEALLAESEAYFKGRSTANVSIRPTSKRYHELLKQSREAVVAADVWDRLIQELDSKNSEKNRLVLELARHESEIAWLNRCEDALPSVGRFNEEDRLMKELPELPEVASDFVDRARAAREAVNESSRKVAEHSEQITQLETRLGELKTSPEILAVEDELDILHQELGAYRKQKDSLEILRGKLAGIEPALRSGMNSLEVQGDFESLEDLRLSSTVRLSIEEATGAVNDARNQHNEVKKKAQELTETIAAQESELQTLPDADLETLREALAVAAEATDANKTLESTLLHVEQLSRKVKQEHALVLGAPADLEATNNLQVPSPATIRKFRERFGQLSSDQETAASKIREEQVKITRLETELARLERSGELPTEDSLRQARDHRDHGWQLVLQEWKGPGAKEQLDPELPLEEAFPKAIESADQIADQLRHDADAVAQAEEKRSQIQGCYENIKQVQAELELNQTKTSACHASWEQEWKSAGIQSRSSDEMEEWREAWVQFRDTLSKRGEADAVLQAKFLQVETARKTLAKALADSPEKPFVVLFEAARKQIQEGEQSAGRRGIIVEQLAKSKEDLASLNLKTGTHLQTLEAALDAWKAKIQSAGLPSDTSPESGLALIKERKELILKYDQWKEWTGEAKATAESLASYDERVEACADDIGIQADTTETREAALWKQLTSAKKIQTVHGQLASQIADARDKLVLAQQEEERSRQELQQLIVLADLDSIEDLEPLLASLEKQTAIEGRLESIRTTLGGLARNEPIEEFISRVEAENVEDLPIRKGQLEAERKLKSEELQLLQSTLSDLNKQRTDLEKAGDAAADFRQQAESAAASLKQDAARYIRLRLASHFLQIQTERFRQENQGPLLEKSSQVFKEITRGAFSGLAAEFNDEDVPILVGQRANGTNVPVEGLSDGSRDQLYLALRLAALERHLEEHEPMPLILDDLLMTFDNDRTKAILPQLANLSKRTQIFLFTHHEHLVDLCRESLGEGNFQLHQLVNQ